MFSLFCTPQLSSDFVGMFSPVYAHTYAPPLYPFTSILKLIKPLFQVYLKPFPASFAGVPFSEIALLVFEQLGATLFAMEISQPGTSINTFN